MESHVDLISVNCQRKKKWRIYHPEWKWRFLRASLEARANRNQITTNKRNFSRRNGRKVEKKSLKTQLKYWIKNSGFRDLLFKTLSQPASLWRPKFKNNSIHNKLKLVISTFLFSCYLFLASQALLMYKLAAFSRKFSTFANWKSFPSWNALFTEVNDWKPKILKFPLTKSLQFWNS